MGPCPGFSATGHFVVVVAAVAAIDAAGSAVDGVASVSCFGAQSYHCRTVPNTVWIVMNRQLCMGHRGLELLL